MLTETLLQPITYPARPVEAGPLERAPAKAGTWYFEPKVNGRRVLAHVPSGQMWNRHGQIVTISDTFSAALSHLARTGIEWADCEALDLQAPSARASLVLLDVLDWAGEPYRQRHARIVERLTADDHFCLDPEAIAIQPEALYFLPAVENHWELPMQLWRACRRANRKIRIELFDGVVAKKGDSTYPVQLVSSGREFPFWHKHRWRW